MRLLIIFLAFLIVSPVFGQRKKKDEEVIVEVAPVYVEGVVYALPRTGIRVYVKSTKNEFTPGPYARYAEQLLGISDVKSERITNWVIDNIKIESFSEPDPANIYKSMGNTAALVGLSPNGCIAGVNSGSFESEQYTPVTNTVFHADNKKFITEFSNLSDLPFIVAGDSASRFSLTRLSIEQKAAQAASRILECRMLRFETAAGLLDEFPPDGKAYDESLKQLEKIEKEYISLFIGKNKKEDYKYSFEYIPSEKSTKGEVIFRFSEEKGVLEKNDFSGKPVIIDVLKMENLAVNFSKLAASENPNAGESGIYYRLPGIAEINIIHELKVISTSRFTVAQFGAVAPVPENFLDGNYKLKFYPETGAVKSITIR